MMDNLDFGITADANHALAVLRGMEISDTLAADQHFAPGIFLSVDPESDTKVRLTSAPGRLCDLDCTTKRPGRWLSLNVELGACDLSRCSVLTLMCKSRAPHTLTFRACLRSGYEGGFVDAFFQKRVIAYGEESVHADVMKPGARDDVPATAPWRELILFFPADLHQITLTDLALVGI